MLQPIRMMKIRLIALLANQYHANVYYLSMTRGDGGQNLIGPEIEELLGVIGPMNYYIPNKADRRREINCLHVPMIFGFLKRPWKLWKFGIEMKCSRWYGK